MSRYIKVLEEIIESQVEKDSTKQQTEGLVINRIEFQKLQCETKLLLESFSSLLSLQIVNCDLRTLENFPIIRSLQDVCVANNRLQGSVEHLTKNEKLKYLDISNNFIKEASKLSSLKRLKGLAVCFKGNPFTKSDNWKTLIENYMFNVENEPRNLSKIEAVEVGQEKHPQQPQLKTKPSLIIPTSEQEGDFLALGRVRLGRPVHIRPLQPFPTIRTLRQMELRGETDGPSFFFRNRRAALLNQNSLGDNSHDPMLQDSDPNDSNDSPEYPQLIDDDDPINTLFNQNQQNFDTDSEPSESRNL